MATGHLRLPNELVEALAGVRLNGSKWQIIWAVWRLTLCWQVSGEWGARAYPVGISDVVDATGLSKSNVKREMGELVKYNIISRDRSPDGEHPSAGGRGHKPMTAFNLDPTTWILPIKGSEMETLSDVSERVAEPHPFGTQKGSEVDTLSETPKGSEVETLSTVKGSEVDTLKVSDRIPFMNESDTLSPRESKLGKKHLKKPKETITIKKPSSEQAIELSHLLKSLILRNNPKAKLPDDITKWAMDFDRMINIDKRTPEEIRSVLEFSQNDSFWCANILSAGKLREKFDQLYLKGVGYGAGRQPPGGGTGAHRADPLKTTRERGWETGGDEGGEDGA